MELIKSKTKKIVLATAITIFSLATCFAGTYAWFSANVEIAANNLTILSESDELNIAYKLYRYDFDLKEGIEYVEGDASLNLSLNDYDNFIVERNINNNNIIRFDISVIGASEKSVGKRKITLKSNISPTEVQSSFDGGFDDGVRRTHIDTSGYKYHNESRGLDYICNNISNIIYFKGIPYSYVIDGETKLFNDDIQIDETTPDTIYKTATKEFKDITEQSSFVTNSAKTQEILISEFEIDAKATNFVFFIEYNYKPELIDAFLKNTEIIGVQDIQMLANKITFQKDIEKIEIQSNEEAK